MKTLNEADETAVRELLLGRRIVTAELGDFDVAGSYWPAKGRLVLDNGTEVFIRPNEGGCACSAGDYDLEHLASVDNVITSVRVADEQAPPDEYGYQSEDAHAYRIYVVADAIEVNVLSVEGDDGNGYYGTGYELFVIHPGHVA
jgi:hypothetical protein